MTNYEIYSLVFMLISTVILVLSAFIGIRNLRLLVASHADNHEWNRRIATQDAITKVREINIDALNQEFGYADQLTAIPLKNINEKFKENPDLQMMCHKLLNFYEGLASGVNLGIYDEMTLKINRRGAMERDFAKFREYILYRRDQVSKSLFIEQEKIITRWHEELLIQSSRETTGIIK